MKINRILNLLLLCTSLALCYSRFNHNNVRKVCCFKPGSKRHFVDVSSSSSDFDRERNRIDQHVQLVQGVLLQATINVEKCAKWYTEELKSLLIEGLGLINRSTLSRLNKDFNRLETNILKIVERVNEEILREAEAIVAAANSELQDVVVALVKATNAQIITDFNGIITSAAGVTPVTIDVVAALELITANFNTLIESVTNAFARATSAEKLALDKVIKDKRTIQLAAIAALITEFERQLSSVWRDLNTESLTFISNTISENTHKFILALEALLNRIGEHIVSAIKGCTVDFRPVVTANPVPLVSVEKRPLPLTFH